eukprot:scaffold62645_cov22-Tisochrysis_lutea.AAC.1
MKFDYLLSSTSFFRRPLARPAPLERKKPRVSEESAVQCTTDVIHLIYGQGPLLLLHPAASLGLFSRQGGFVLVD